MKWRWTKEDCFGWLVGWLAFCFLEATNKHVAISKGQFIRSCMKWTETKQKIRKTHIPPPVLMTKILIQKAMNCWLVDFKWYVVQYSITQTHLLFGAFCLLNLFAFVSFVRDQCANTRATTFWWRTKIEHR